VGLVDNAANPPKVWVISSICLIEFNFRVCKLSGKKIHASCYDSTKLPNINQVHMERIYSCFWIKHEVEIIKLHIIDPLKDMKQTYCFTHIHSAQRNNTQCFYQNKRTLFTLQAYTCNISLLWIYTNFEASF